MPSPTEKTTPMASSSSSSSPPAQAQPPAVRKPKPSASSSRVRIRTKIPSKTPAKRKRPLMPKDQSKNKKNWARGAREQIMLAHLPKYTEELAKGGKGAADYAVKICHEFNYKIPYDMPDSQDPDTIPEYDHENPPPLPKLSDEKEKERAAALRIRNKARLQHRVVNWLNYRARKVVSAIPKGSSDVNNAFALWMMRLTGTSGAPKKARQGWQQYQHENSELVQESAQRAWDAKEAAREGGEGEVMSEEEEDEEEEEEEEGEGRGEGKGDKDVGGGTKRVKGVGFVSKHARKLFDSLPLEERRALKARAKAEKEEQKRLWEEAIKAPPSQHPQDVQAARDAIPSFLNPILDGINRVAGDAHVYVMVGGREPKRGGVVTVQHYDIGTNKDGVYFRDWDPQRLNRDVLGFFGEYLTTVWRDEDCARMALGTGAEGDDGLEDAQYQIDDVWKDEEDGDDGGGEDGEGGGGGGEEEANNGGAGEDGEEAGGWEYNGLGCGGEEGGLRDGWEGDEEDGGSGEDDVDQRPSKRQRVRKDISLGDGPDAPQATPPAVEAPGLSAKRPPRPKPQPTRRSARQAETASQAVATPPPAIPPISAQDLAGIPIDPVLLRPPFAQVPHPEVDLPTPGNQCASTVEGAPPASLPRPSRTASTSSTHIISNPAAALTSPHRTSPLAPMHTAAGGEIAAVFPDAPAGAETWFVAALDVLRAELGGEWDLLIQSWAHYESERDYGKDLPARSSRLDGAKTRPKEVSAWIAGGRWRSPGCEPAKKNGKFASALMQSWWAWYVKLAPDWREEDEDGRLEDFVDFGEGMGKLDVPGVNGVLSLIICLKWVGEALVSGKDIHDRAGVDRSWRRATADLAKMLGGMKSS